MAGIDVAGGGTPSLTNTLTDTHIFVGDSNNEPADVALTLSPTGGSFALANTGVLTMPNANATTRGLLTAADWVTFNNKQNVIADWTTAFNAAVQATSSWSATNAAANVNAAIVPKGTGAILAAVPDGTATGGNARGTYAVDLQLLRTAATQVSGSTGSTIGGGYRNTITGQFTTYSTISGGDQNLISAVNGNHFIGGGSGNQILNSANEGNCVVAGGLDNQLRSGFSVISGGRFNDTNNASQYYQVIGGGFQNNSSNEGATIAGGASNNITGNYGSVGGGQSNSITQSHSTVSGGQTNTASNSHAAIAGGQTNTASGTWGFVGGGRNNSNGGTQAVISGGRANSIGSGAPFFGEYNVIGGGWNNNASSASSCTIGGGQNNQTNQNGATVAGGNTNICTTGAGGGFIGGGNNNTASATNAVIAGGLQIQASGNYSFCGGGAYSIASGVHSVVCGGGDSINTALRNTASGGASFIGSGQGNTASASFTSVMGGFQATASLYGQQAYSAGRFSANGDAQAHELIWRAAITGAPVGGTELFLDGASIAAILPGTNAVWHGIMDVSAVCTSTGNGTTVTGDVEATSYKVTIKRIGTNTVLVGTVQEIGTTNADASMSTATFTIDANNTNESLRIVFTSPTTAGTTTTFRALAVFRGSQIQY